MEKLAIGGEVVDAAIAVAVGDENATIRGDGAVRRRVKWASRPDPVRVAVVASVGFLAWRADHQQQLPLRGELAERVIATVHTIDRAVWADLQAVRYGENALTPGTQQCAVPVEHDHRVRAPIENVDSVLGINDHPNRVNV